MNIENCRSAAARYFASDADLMRVCQAANDDLRRHMASTDQTTQAHVGLLELAQACADELAARGYHRGAKADGSDLPVDVCYETVCGVTTRLSFSVRCF